MAPEVVNGPQKLPEGSWIAEKLGLSSKNWRISYFNEKFLGEGGSYMAANACLLFEPISSSGEVENCFLLAFSEQKPGEVYLSPNPGNAIGAAMAQGENELTVNLSFRDDKKRREKGPSLGFYGDANRIGFKEIRIWSYGKPLYDGHFQKVDMSYREKFDCPVLFTPSFDTESEKWVLYIIDTRYLHLNIELSDAVRQKLGKIP